MARDVQLSFLKRLLITQVLLFYPSATATAYRCLPLGTLAHSIWTMTKEIRKFLKVSIKITFHLCWLCSVDVFGSERLKVFSHYFVVEQSVASRALVNYTVKQSALCLHLLYCPSLLKSQTITVILAEIKYE